MQLDDQDIMQPIAFYSRQMLAAECNYDIYDKELLVIVSWMSPSGLKKQSESAPKTSKFYIDAIQV